jgi:hypothetical protein
MKYGFWHLGRFSGYYRELFGEYPSETARCMEGTIPGRADRPILDVNAAPVM